MKKLIGLVLICALFAVVPLAQAVDLDAALKTADAMQRKTAQMYNVINQAKTGGYQATGLPDKTFSAAEKQALLDLYASLKSDIQMLLDSLP